MSDRLSENFNRSEFACQCGCGFDTVDAGLIRLLEWVRAHFDAPITITSGCRCPAHNKAVGGGHQSQHKKGRAADFKVKGVPAHEVYAFCDEVMQYAGVGKYKSWTHIDSRGVKARW